MSCKSYYRFLTPYQNLEKTNDTVPRKRLTRQTDQQRDKQALIYTTLLAATWSPNILIFSTH